MRIFRLIIIFFLGVFSLSAMAQKNCNNYLERKCGGYGPPFKYSGQSKSAMFEKGQKSSFYLVTYGGYEYNVTICAQKQLEDIYFRILENNPQKTVLYDSSVEGDGSMAKQFYVSKTKKLIVEVAVPNGELSPEDEDYEDRIGCVGVVIEYARPPKKGFDE